MSTLATPHEGPAAGEPGPTFQRRLGLFDSTMLVVGTMIGSGIFVTSVAIAQDVGSAGWLLAVWALAGVMTIVGALSYAELAGMMPHAGGQYVYLRESYSPLWGFLYGWTCFLVIQTGSIAAVAVAFAKYFGVLVPSLGTDANVPKDVAPLQGFMPDLGWSADSVHAIVVYAATHVNLALRLPWMSEPFFEMTHFVVTGGHLVAVAIIAFLTWLNCRGVREGKTVQNVMTVAKTLALLFLIVVGLSVVSNAFAKQANWADPWGGMFETKAFEKQNAAGVGRWIAAFMVMGGAMVGALFSSDAWNNITFTAGEIRNPRRNLPWSLALGTGTVVILYMLANWAYVSSLPVRGEPDPKPTILPAEIERLGTRINPSADQEETLRSQSVTLQRGIDNARDERVGTAVMELWSPRLGAPLMAIAIMISTFGCVNGMILMGARLYYVMAQDNLFFRSVGFLNRRAVPAVGLALQGLWSIVLVFSGTYNELLDFVIFAVLVFYVLTVIGLFILRRTQPNAERPYRAIGYPILPALYVLLCAAIMIDLLIVKPKFTWPGLIIVLTGIPVYFIWRAVAAVRPA
jgi:APA family basic amino acid/polyamine antiporter